MKIFRAPSSFWVFFICFLFPLWINAQDIVKRLNEPAFETEIIEFTKYSLNYMKDELPRYVDWEDLEYFFTENPELTKEMQACEICLKYYRVPDSAQQVLGGSVPEAVSISYEGYVTKLNQREAQEMKSIRTGIALVGIGGAGIGIAIIGQNILVNSARSKYEEDLQNGMALDEATDKYISGLNTASTFGLISGVLGAGLIVGGAITASEGYSNLIKLKEEGNVQASLFHALNGVTLVLKF